MARRQRKTKISESQDEAQVSKEITILDAKPETTIGELIVTSKKPVASRRRNAQPAKAQTAAIDASAAQSAGLETGPGNPLADQTNLGIAGVNDGNFSKRRFQFIPKIHFSYILILLILIFCAVPMIEVSYEVPVAYQDVEKYTEQEPYVESIPYTEKEPYTTTEAYNVVQPYTVTVPYVYYPNAPPTSGNSTPPPPLPQVRYRDTTRFMNVTQYRDVTQYQDVQKLRNEVRLRPVQKQRTVTRVRMETRYKVVPVLYYLVDY